MQKASKTMINLTNVTSDSAIRIAEKMDDKSVRSNAYIMARYFRVGDGSVRTVLMKIETKGGPSIFATKRDAIGFFNSGIGMAYAKDGDLVAVIGLDKEKMVESNAGMIAMFSAERHETEVKKLGRYIPVVEQVTNLLPDMQESKPAMIEEKKEEVIPSAVPTTTPVRPTLNRSTPAPVMQASA